MARLGYSIRLFRDFVAFARHNKAYWIIPLVVVLGAAAAIVVVGQTSAPLLYTLF